MIQPPDWRHRRDARKWVDPMIEHEEHSKPDLLEMGTRWQHYVELRDLFADGIEIIKRMTIKSSADAVKRVKLEAAVELLNARLNLLSDFIYNTTSGSKLRSVIENDVDTIYRRLKMERLNAEKAKPTNDDDESPSSYTTK
jgi:hypothetical protein